MFLIKSWSLEDCFPRLFLVAEVWIWSSSPGSNPTAFISDLGSLELNLYLEAKKSNHSPIWRDVPNFPQESVKLFEPFESYKHLHPTAIWGLQTSILQLVSVFCFPMKGRLGNLWIPWSCLRKSQHLCGRVLLFSSCSPTLASAPPCHGAHMARAVLWWEKWWKGKWGHVGKGTVLQLITLINNSLLSIWGLFNMIQRGWMAVNAHCSGEITILSILRKLIQWS